MNPQTSDHTSKKLGALIAAHHSEGPDALHAHILDVFRVLDKPAPRTAQPKPAVGQTWRNRTSGRLVKITDLGRTGYWSQRIAWECIDGSRGQKFGGVSANYWTDRFDFEEPTNA